MEYCRCIFWLLYTIISTNKLKNRMADNYNKYYNDKFRIDIQKFLMSIPEESRHHHDRDDKTTFTIQYEKLTQDFDHLSFLTKQEKIFFGISLFFTVLVDQVCYTHYKKEYDKFKQLTQYPKFIGDCLTMCNYHFHPHQIFSAMNYSKRKKLDINSHYDIDFSKVFIEATPIMEKEIKDFFRVHKIVINENEFWIKCKNEFLY